ncbi:MAG TPA: LysM peptidoglycan-binding domain-containing protein [Candidatus Binatia bacterium]|nr:LysM peptidoglycan-binding domain-containing protein [Candidatus Binatia bacterium]
MRPLRVAPWAMSLCLLAIVWGRPSVRAESPPPIAASGAEEGYFLYPLRPGESLSDVARIFRVRVEEIAALNQIKDPNRLQVAQLLRVPDGFAREAAELRAERERLRAEKRRVDRESDARQRKIAGLETDLRQLRAEKDAVNAELAANVQWHKAATLASILFLCAFVWGLKSRFDRANLARRERALSAENAALITAKDKYRQAASQLELRYQNLYGKKSDEPVPYAVAEGIERLGRAFEEGSGELERLLARLKAERQQHGKLLQAEEKVRAWLFRPVRELLERQRVKYHTP